MALLEDSKAGRRVNRKAQKGQGKPKVAYGGSRLHYGHSVGKCRCGGTIYATNHAEHECNKCGSTKPNVWKLPPLRVGEKHGSGGQGTMNHQKKARYKPRTFLEKDCMDIIGKLRCANEDAINGFLDKTVGYHSVHEIAKKTGVSVNDTLSTVVRLEQDARLSVLGTKYGRLA